MFSLLRPPSALCGLLVTVCALTGCGGVRQDRTISFSADGGQVGFQHGQEGLFVADKDGKELVKIFTPGKDVQATSTPLWAPNDHRLIFATARVAADQPARPLLHFREDDPAGRIHFEQAAVYTCWLRDEPREGVTPEPRELFTASCDHIGYIGANFALRWHPKGQRICYINQVSTKQHALFEYDLATKTSRRVFPAADTAKALIFDWSPTGTYLACLLAGTPGGKADGLWIRSDDEVDWWQVRESRPLARGELASTLEALKATQPAWSADGTRLAFTTDLPGKTQGEKARHFLWQVELAERRTSLLTETAFPIQGVRWHPKEQQLGYRLVSEPPVVQVATAIAQPRTLGGKRPVRAFAGWSASGGHLAYVTPDDIPLSQADNFSLLRPDPLARDAIYVATGEGNAEGRLVFSGMRATFLNWSPNEDKLSLWLTFAPTHRSLLNDLGLGLRPGDPAATLDLATGQIHWMAVNALEKAQIGHYYLLKRDYATALSWYEEAEKLRLPQKDARPDEPTERLLELLDRRQDFSFFAAHCLTKLGRTQEAAKQRTRFDEGSRALKEQLTALLNPVGAPPDATRERLLRDLGWLIALLDRLYQAEVFLSLDAVSEGRLFFEALREKGTTEERLAAAVVLAQFLLLEGKTLEYAEEVTTRIVPLLRGVWQPGERKLDANDDISDRLSLGVLVGHLTILPLQDHPFLKRLPAHAVERLLSQWQDLRKETRDEASLLVIDRTLTACYERLEKRAEAEEARRRCEANPVRARLDKAAEELPTAWLGALFAPAETGK